MQMKIFVLLPLFLHAAVAGKTGKLLTAFIDEIPDSKLEALPNNAGTIYTDDDFRLDMQGVSRASFAKYTCVRN
jgi:hypothetical protein